MSGDLLTQADRIHIGGVEKIDPRFEKYDEMLPRLILVERPFGLRTDAVAHTAKTDTRHGHPRVAKLCKLHSSPLSPPNKIPSFPQSRDTCLRRYDTIRTVIPMQTGIQGGGSKALVTSLPTVLSGVLTIAVVVA